MLLAACSSVKGPYVWAEDYPMSTDGSAYTVAPGDLLFVQVWDAEKYSAHTRVRSDGQISIPLLNDVEAAGRTPTQIGRIVEERLRRDSLLRTPRVTVAVEEIKPVTVAVLGAVVRAGTYSLDRGNGVADALASAGGLNEFAHKDRIFVIRRVPPSRIRFSLASLTDSIGRAALFRLRPGDIVFAE
jgi:polysaccharide export outer membrane protein